MKNRPKISIIVPVYKVEPYLCGCVDSILAQTFTDFELILVDDGSPDNCPMICEEYAKKDSRVRVLHKENGGVSSARNAGVNAARGEYIGFIDSDDLIEPNMFSILTDIAVQYDADVVQCRHNGLDSIQGVTHLGGAGRVVDGKTFVREIFEHKGGDYTNDVALWSKIYRQELFDGIQFPVGHNFEDERETYKICLKADKIVLISDELYHYVRHENSITTTASAKNMLDKQLALMDRMFFLTKQLPDLEEKSVRAFIAYSENIMCQLYKIHDEEWLHKAINNVKDNWNVVKPYANKYDRIYYLLLHFKSGREWILKNDFEPIQRIVRKLKRK